MPTSRVQTPVPTPSLRFFGPDPFRDVRLQARTLPPASMLATVPCGSSLVAGDGAVSLGWGLKSEREGVGNKIPVDLGPRGYRRDVLATLMFLFSGCITRSSIVWVGGELGNGDHVVCTCYVLGPRPRAKFRVKMLDFERRDP